MPHVLTYIFKYFKQFFVSLSAFVGLIASLIVSFYTDGWEGVRSKKLRLVAFYKIASSVKLFLFD